MKKFLSVFVALALLVFAGCANNQGVKASEKSLSIVTTIFPTYDFIREILGEKADDASITVLTNSSTDLHNYQPTADDIIKIYNCDMFVYVGGESDLWVGDVLKQDTNKDMVVVNLFDVLGDKVKTEEYVEGMEHDHDYEHDEEHEHEQDEHVWLSLLNTKTICSYLADKLCEIDSDNKNIYSENINFYVSKLDELNAQYQDVINKAENKTLLFADRFPFRYLVDDYGLEYYAAFSGCSAESEASFETVIFLANKIDELGLNSVLTIDGSTNQIAKTVIENTANKNQEILTLNSMQSAYDINDSYISIMSKNLEVLKQALKVTEGE